MILRHGRASEVIIHAPAKVNLFFEVLGKRTDGFHEIESLMCPIDRYDTLVLQEDRSGQVQLTCDRAGDGPPAPDDGRPPSERLPTDRANLIVRAIELLRRETATMRGARVRLIKRIPIASGLGGGSSDAAAALWGANVLWRLGLSREELFPLAARLGSDVPFFLAAGPAVCRGRGERIEPVVGHESFALVIARPPVGLATAAVYGACRPAETPRLVRPAVEALRTGDMKKLGAALWNRLQPAAAGLSPWIDRLAQRFAQLDLPGHAMSGSGTSYFGLCRHARHARCVARRILAPGAGSVFAARMCRDG